MAETTTHPLIATKYRSKLAMVKGIVETVDNPDDQGQLTEIQKFQINGHLRKKSAAWYCVFTCIWPDDSLCSLMILNSSYGCIRDKSL